MPHKSSSIERQSKVHNIYLFGSAIDRTAIDDMALVGEILRALKAEISNLTLTLFADNPAVAQKTHGVETVSNSMRNWRACIPMVAISYEPKVYGFMKLIGQENLVCHVESFNYEDCVSKVKYAWSHREFIRQEMAPRIRELKEKAALNAKLAKELLLRSKYRRSR